jgi:hypothetical protein
LEHLDERYEYSCNQNNWSLGTTSSTSKFRLLYEGAHFSELHPESRSIANFQQSYNHDSKPKIPPPKNRSAAILIRTHASTTLTELLTFPSVGGVVAQIEHVLLHGALRTCECRYKRNNAQTLAPVPPSATLNSTFVLFTLSCL